MYVKAVKVRGLKESPGDRHSRILFLYGFSRTEVPRPSSQCLSYITVWGLSGAIRVRVQLPDVAKVCVCRICNVLGVVCVI